MERDFQWYKILFYDIIIQGFVIIFLTVILKIKSYFLKRVKVQQGVVR